jgi:predicted lipid-binding transport protein (Tim44 family)
MWIAVGIALLVGWILLKLIWGVASFAVHLLLIAAVVAVIVHVVRMVMGRRRTTVTP